VSAEEYKTEFDKYINIGANIIGGCCGMGPEDMKKIYDLYKKN